jgi:hypothetical protein
MADALAQPCCEYGTGIRDGGTVDRGTLVLLAVLFVLSGLIGMAIGGGKGRGLEGFVLGLFLGVIGWIIVTVMGPYAAVQARRDQALAEVIASATDGSVVGPHGVLGPTASARLRQCPYCAELIEPEAIKCRYCGEATGPGGVGDHSVASS